MAGWEIAQSTETNNPRTLLLDFHGLGGDFSVALCKVGASGGVLWALGGLVDDLVATFGETRQQDDKMDQVRAKLAASCAQELPRCCQDSQPG